MMFQNILASIFRVIAAIGIIFGPLIGYIAQLLKINSLKNSQGFSTYVCTILILANILRIFFW